MRHLLDLSGLGRETLLSLLDTADEFKDERGAARHSRLLAGKSVALVFEKASTRTRVSLEVAVSELGGHPITLGKEGSQLGRGEPIEDTARVLSRMVHAVTYRTFSDESLRTLAQHSSVPILNALTDGGHPMQLLADLQTVRREFGTLDGLSYAWIGDGNNMAHSWIEAATVLGFELRIACPEGFEPDPERLATAKQKGGNIVVERDPKRACAGVQVVSTDVFASMGQEDEAAERLKAFRGYCVDTSVMAVADPSAIVLHCLPAHRGEEIAADVLEGPQSRVWEEAEARLHTSKAALCWALDVRPR